MSQTGSRKEELLQLCDICIANLREDIADERAKLDTEMAKAKPDQVRIGDLQRLINRLNRELEDECAARERRARE